MTWVDTRPPGTKWLLGPRLQLRLNLTRLTSLPMSSAALDELGPSAISQIEREKIPFVFMKVLHECELGALEGSVTHVGHIQWAKKSGEHIDPGGAWRLNQTQHLHLGEGDGGSLRIALFHMEET